MVQESEPKSNEHVQIVARAGSANLMDAKAAISSQPSQIGCIIHTAGLAQHHLMLEQMSKEGLVHMVGRRDVVLYYVSRQRLIFLLK